MLPYHLRPPIYGGKLKRQKEQQESPASLRNPYIGGGPFQRAIEQDLLDLRGDFQGQLSQIIQAHITPPLLLLDNQAVVDTDSSGPHPHHRQGLAFGVFKQVFGAAKVARLHTRLAPPRCDPNAYAQLIYAACLSLLKQASSCGKQKDANTNTNQEEDNDSNDNNDNDDDQDLKDAAYAVFCLYALYETNPLPHGRPEDNPSRLAMLSMALQNRENPKLLFRRAFQSRIRIDPEHYVYLSTLRDLALSQIADCGRSNQRPKPSSDSDSESSFRDTAHPPLSKRRCHCAIAQDVVQVMDRLWKHLDLCAYTGPCSAEGLAGHADYPFPGNEQAAKSSIVSTATNTTMPGAALDLLLPATATTTEPWQHSEHLQQRLQDYLSSRQSMRLPALQANMPQQIVQQTKRVRQALEPMFARNKQHAEGTEDPLSRLSNVIQGLGTVEEAAKPRTLRRVTFGSVMVGGDAHSVVSSKRNTGDTEASLVPGDAAAAEAEALEDSSPSYQLILPDEMPVALQESIQTAVETLMDQGETLLGFSEPNDVSDSIHGGGDVSTLGNGGVSTASTATGIGRNALQTLLSQAGNGNGDASVASGIGRNALHDLLALARNRETGTVAESNAMQNLLSQAPGSDDASAATGIGRDALQDLLAQARYGETGTVTGRNSLQDLLSQAGDEDASTTTGNGRNALQDLLAQASNGDTGTATRRNSVQELPSQAGDEDGSTATGNGRNALQNLLAQARNGEDGSTKSSVGRNTLPAPRRRQADLFLDTEEDDTKARAGRKSVSSDVDLSDVSSDDEVASLALSRVGKRALDDLVSAGKKKRATVTPKRKAVARQVRRSTREKRPRPNSAIDSIEDDRPNIAIDSIEDDSEDEGRDEDVHSAQSEVVDRGKSALDDLLKLAMGRNK